jgi:manganese transport protein
MLLSNPFKGILWSQIALSLQLPFIIIPLILLTSSIKVTGGYANRPYGAIVLWIVGLVVIGLNIALLADMARG